MVIRIKKPNDELDKFLLRMPDGLRERIKLAADANNRSMNAEIVSALEATFPEEVYRYTEVKLVHELDQILEKISEVRNSVIAQVEETVTEDFKSEAIEPLKKVRLKKSIKRSSK